MSKIKSIGFSYIDTALDEILNRNYTFIGILNTLSITFRRKFSMNGIIRLLCPRARDLDQLVHG